MITCHNCQHDTPHNVFGKCKTSGCTCKDYQADASVKAVNEPEEPRSLHAKVTVLRNQATNQPVAIPDEIVAEAERPYRAYLDHAAGHSWEEIAVAGQWSSPAAVAAAVRDYLDEGRAVWAEHRRVEGIAMEVARLGMLQKAFWAKAMEGEIPAGVMSLNVIKERIKLLRLDEREPGDIAENGIDPMATTVVVGYDTMADDLQAIVEGSSSKDWTMIFEDDDPDSEPYLEDTGTV